MFCKVLIIYKTTKNKTIFRLVDYPLVEIGDYTSMGWYVLDIQYFYKGRFYSKNEFYHLVDINKNKKENFIKSIINKWL